MVALADVVHDACFTGPARDLIEHANDLDTCIASYVVDPDNDQLKLELIVAWARAQLAFHDITGCTIQED
jgi:hypothetical protein